VHVSTTQGITWHRRHRRRRAVSRPCHGHSHPRPVPSLAADSGPRPGVPQQAAATTKNEGLIPRRRRGEDQRRLSTRRRQQDRRGVLVGRLAAACRRTGDGRAEGLRGRPERGREREGRGGEGVVRSGRFTVVVGRSSDGRRGDAGGRQRSCAPVSASAPAANGRA